MGAVTRPARSETGPSRAAERPWRWFWLVLVTVAGAALAVVRTTPTSQWFALGSEDGPIFTDQVRSHGVVRSFFTTYAGYYHLLPRVVAAIASPFSLRATPFIYGLGAALIAGLCGTIAARCARGAGMSWPTVALTWAIVVLLPGSGWETALWLTMVEWYVIATFVVFAASWIAGYDPPHRWSIPLLVIGGLTSPLLVVSLPFLAWRAWQRRSRRALVVPAVVLLTAIVHLIGRAVSSPPRGSGNWTPQELVRMYGVRVVGGMIGGANGLPELVEEAKPKAFVVLAVVVVAAMSFAALRLDRERRWTVWYLVYASIVYLAVAIVIRPAFFVATLPIGAIVIDGRHTFWNLRYMAAPITALLFATLVFADHYLRSPRQIARVASIACLTFIGSMVVVNVPVYLHRDTVAHWDEQVESAQQQCRQHPDGTITIAYGPPASRPAWRLQLTCAAAFHR